MDGSGGKARRGEGGWLHCGLQLSQCISRRKTAEECVRGRLAGECGRGRIRSQPDVAGCQAARCELVRNLVRKCSRQPIRVGSREQPDAATDDSLLVAERRPCDSDTGLRDDRLRVIEQVGPVLHCGVIRNRQAALVAGRIERHVGQHEAVLIAGRVEILLHAQAEGQLQVLGDRPFVGDVVVDGRNAEVQRAVLRIGLAKRAAQAGAREVQLAVGEIRQVVDVVSAKERARRDARVRIFVVTNRYTSFEGVPAFVPRQIVRELNMTDVAAIGKRSGSNTRKRIRLVTVRAAVVDRDGIRHQRAGLGEIGDAEQSGVPQNRPDEVVHEGRRDNRSQVNASLP